MYKHVLNLILKEPRKSSNIVVVVVLLFAVTVTVTLQNITNSLDKSYRITSHVSLYSVHISKAIHYTKHMLSGVIIL